MLLACGCLVSFAQDKPLARSDPESNTIKGHVLGEGGRAMRNVDVQLYSSARNAGPARVVATDGKGRFVAPELQPGAYSVIVRAPGYVTGAGDTKVTRAVTGDDVTLRLVKGGVVTGHVRTVTDEPVVNARVAAIRVRDADG